MFQFILDRSGLPVYLRDGLPFDIHNTNKGEHHEKKHDQEKKNDKGDSQRCHSVNHDIDAYRVVGSFVPHLERR